MTENITYQYRTLSVTHLEELREDFDRQDRAGKLSQNETYREYLSEQSFGLPEKFPDAKSIIVLAVFTRLMLVDFHTNGGSHKVMLPPQYYDAGVSKDFLQKTIADDIIKNPGYRVERANDSLFLKLLAVRSGLGRYGRNNLCYVEGMGSFITLYGYLTDFQFEEDHWTELGMMESCKNCRACMQNCPTGCFSEENFVIDVGKCISLYNEVPGEFPDWIPPDAHNALIGCMKCQLPCPVNRKVPQQTGRLEDVTTDETQAVLAGNLSEAMRKTLSRKLRRFYPAEVEEYFPIFTRNLSVLVK